MKMICGHCDYQFEVADDDVRIERRQGFCDRCLEPRKLMLVAPGAMKYGVKQRTQSFKEELQGICARLDRMEERSSDAVETDPYTTTLSGSIESNDAEIKPGGATQVRWSVKGAKTVYYMVSDEKPREVAHDGESDVSPDVDTTYRILAFDDKGNWITDAAQVMVYSRLASDMLLLKMWRRRELDRLKDSVADGVNYLTFSEVLKMDPEEALKYYTYLLVDSMGCFVEHKKGTLGSHKSLIDLSSRVLIQRGRDVLSIAAVYMAVMRCATREVQRWRGSRYDERQTVIRCNGSLTLADKETPTEMFYRAVRVSLQSKVYDAPFEHMKDIILRMSALEAV